MSGLSIMFDITAIHKISDTDMKLNYEAKDNFNVTYSLLLIKCTLVWLHVHLNVLRHYNWYQRFCVNINLMWIIIFNMSEVVIT